MSTQFVKSGRHYNSQWLMRLAPLMFNVQSIEISFTLHEDALVPPFGLDQINKLAGVAAGLGPHGTSVRLGWDTVAIDGKIRFRIWKYDYVDGVRQEPVLMYYTDPGVPHKEVLRLPKKSFLCTKLFFYFGGQKTAPQKVSAEISYRKV